MQPVRHLSLSLVLNPGVRPGPAGPAHPGPDLPPGHHQLPVAVDPRHQTGNDSVSESEMSVLEHDQGERANGGLGRKDSTGPKSAPVELGVFGREV